MLSTPKYAGEPSVEALASGLATLGRYGDEYMVHAAEGETVVPKEILDSNPQLKQDLFRQMMMMGIKDPNRYVVGNSLNSINPVTGQPEFFFKKIFKSLKKVFKKALPIIATVAGNYIMPGIGGIIASGLVTKLQGGSWGDALKSAAMSFVGQGIMGGVGGALSNAPGATFLGGLQQGFTTPFTAASNLFSSGPLNPLSQGIFGSAKALAGKGLFGTPTYNPQAGMPSVAGTAGASAAGAGPMDTFVEGQTGPTGTTAYGDLGGAPPTAGVPTTGAGPIPTTGTEELLQASGPELTFVTDPSTGQRIGISARQAAALRSEGVLTTDSFGTNQIDANRLAEFNRQAPAPTVSAPQAGVESDITSFDGEFDPVDGMGPGEADVIGDPRVTNVVQEAGTGQTDSSLIRKAQQLSPFADDSYTTADGRTVYGTEARIVAQKEAVANAQKLLAKQNIPTTDPIYDQTIKSAKQQALLDVQPGAVQKWGALGLAGALAYNAYSEEEEEFKSKADATNEEYAAYDEWKKISDKNSPQAQQLFFKWYGRPTRTRSEYEYLTGGPSSRPDWRFLPEPTPGGLDYGTRRAMGGEVIGPGTGTSDSIPARLSDGEFVMTAEAVRNAGGGDRDLGAARMYDMMRRFEGGTA